mmetsp:Transcript_169076/g.543368  ORF Transcript_169076/g.543368 Transcript_169076/m.543368 type:complete len:241 (-) Transcript_169076:6-728(-)
MRWNQSRQTRLFPSKNWHVVLECSCSAGRSRCTGSWAKYTSCSRKCTSCAHASGWKPTSARDAGNRCCTWMLSVRTAARCVWTHAPTLTDASVSKVSKYWSEDEAEPKGLFSLLLTNSDAACRSNQSAEHAGGISSGEAAVARNKACNFGLSSAVCKEVKKSTRALAPKGAVAGSKPRRWGASNKDDISTSWGSKSQPGELLNTSSLARTRAHRTAKWRPLAPVDSQSINEGRNGSMDSM